MTCPNHPNEPKLGYLDASADAERRMKRGEQQWRCGLCKLWVWGEFLINMEGAKSEAWERREQRERDREGKRDGQAK